jgi:hypothetical protein
VELYLCFPYTPSWRGQGQISLFTPFFFISKIIEMEWLTKEKDTLKSPGVAQTSVFFFMDNALHLLSDATDRDATILFGDYRFTGYV